jgi:hypothetical protein
MGILKSFFFMVNAFQQKSNASCNPLPARDWMNWELNWVFLILPNELISRQGPEIKYMSKELCLLKRLGVFFPGAGLCFH